MNHKFYVQLYNDLLKQYKRKAAQYKRYFKIPSYTPVKYKRNITAISVQRLANAMKRLDTLGKAAAMRRKKARAKARKAAWREQEKKLRAAERTAKKAEKALAREKQRLIDKEYRAQQRANKILQERREKDKQKVSELGSGTALRSRNTVELSTDPSVVDMYWDRLMDTLEAAAAGEMSSFQPYYNPAKRKISSQGRRMVEHNASIIEEMLQKALQQRINSGMDESAAKKSIIQRLESKQLAGLRSGDLIYEVERLAYAVYDREYSRWGRRQFMSKLSQIANALNLTFEVKPVQNVAGQVIGSTYEVGYGK